MFRRLPLLLLSFLAIAPAAAAQLSPDEYAAHRAALAAGLGRGAVVALGAPEPRLDYTAFYQGPRFIWLTGYREPDAALVIAPRPGGAAPASMLFVEPHDAAREVWTGHRYGPEGAAKETGIPARPIAELPGVLDSLAAAGLPLAIVSDAPEGQDAARVQGMMKHPTAAAPASLDDAVDRLRGTKSATELALIRKAVAITVDAQREAMRLIAPGMNEFEVQALIEYTFRRNGAERPSFASIVGSGPNSTTLHYNADDRFMNAGETLVMDIGASYKGYAADVTRTVPVSGRYSPEQRAIYTIVRSAQAAGERQATLGANAGAMADSATAVLAAGLASLGLIQSAGASYDCTTPSGMGRCPQYRLYYMHGLGHGIGLEVHDPEQYYYTRTIQPGSAFTIEPGIYVRADVLETLPDTPGNRAVAAALRPAVAKYANIGIRIEDDYIATERGVEWISRAPREMDEIEALMAEPWTGPAARDSVKVDWYRP